MVDRIKTHVAKKDFWTRAYIFTSKDDYLTKTQIKYLEHRIYQAAKAAARVILDSATIPTTPSISEPDQVESDLFLASMKLLLAATGVQVIEARTVSVSSQVASSPIFELRRKGALARMAVAFDGYVIVKGSTAVPTMQDSASAFIGRMREELLAAGVLAPDGTGLLRFEQDTQVDSPSAASPIVYVSMNRTGSELLFQFLAARYERGSLVITTNLEFKEWPHVFGDEKMTAALVDRVTHRAHILVMNGESYRFRESLRRHEAVREL